MQYSSHASSRPYLFPVPQEFKMGDSKSILIPSDGLFVEFQNPPSRNLANLSRSLGFSENTPDSFKIIADINAKEMPHEQGYRIRIKEKGIELVGADNAGLFYGLQTLASIMEQSEKGDKGYSLECMEIEDWPDYPTRAFLLDVSRDRVPTMETLYHLVDRLAMLRINQFQLYFEHAFAYAEHKTVWKNSSPVKADELKELDEYCREKGIELVPNQNSLSHMHRWITHKKYQPLSEHPDKVDAKYLKKENYQHEGNPGHSLCPQDPRTLSLISSLHAEMRKNVQSHKFNCGLDEPHDLGLRGGRSTQEIHRGGMNAVYGKYLREIYGRLKEQDPETELQFWADAILFEPEVLDNLPKDSVLLLWGYEPDFPFDKLGKKLSDRNLKWYVCPSTCDWSSIGGRTQNAIANLSRAALDGLKEHASGYLITEWGDNGHHQPLAVSYLGTALGANFAWNASQAKNFNFEKIKPLISRVMFGNPTGEMADIAARVGDVYQTALLSNSSLEDCSALFRLLVFNGSLPDKEVMESLSADGLQRASEILKEAKANLLKVKLGGDQQSLAVTEEYEWVIDILSLSCRFGILLLQHSPGELSSLRQLPRNDRKLLIRDLKLMIKRYETVWKKRNREGGMKDSTRRLKHLVKLLGK